MEQVDKLHRAEEKLSVVQAMIASARKMHVRDGILKSTEYENDILHDLGTALEYLEVVDSYIRSYMDVIDPNG